MSRAVEARAVPVEPVDRRARIRERLVAEDLGALLVLSRANVRYLSGFTGSAGVLVVDAEGGDLLVTDGRYDAQARAEASEGVGVEIASDPALEVARRRLRDRGVERVAFESEHLSVAALEEWREAGGHEPTGVKGWIEALRSVKADPEIEAIRRAAAVVDAVFEDVLDSIRPGIAERELAAEVDRLLARQGSEGRAFETIVAFGSRSALPHARPGARTLESGEVVLLDFGAVVDGYHSDLTRTVACGEPGKAVRELHAVVRRAQGAALEGLRPGMTGPEADALARDVLEEAGHAERFPHSLGHGLGLEVHEAPRLSRKSEDRLESGMVVTVEPGIYEPGRAGIRIEDDVLLTPDGALRLTRASRDMKIL
ncbi:MAG: Xaa-Pro peptidase family protein [Gemmatimonadetes bacterium]|nr:Xaa-Pro peptidase family protein [Gemmatimonadota bacterium]